ncbi:MAG: hypothetical protein ABSB23_15595 [Bryobacteraceae bacterium]|jgi:hypothetical protein
MRLRTLALALALACSFTAAGEAKKTVIRPAAKSVKLKKPSKIKAKKRKHQKHYKQAKIKHR